MSRLLPATLFEGRFKSSLLDSARYCLVCYRYIELNPVRADMVASPDSYRWSSHHCNAFGKKDSLITAHEEWMTLGMDSHSRCAAYRALFDQSSQDSIIKQIRYTNRKGLPLGSESFKTEIESQLQIKLGTGKAGRTPSSK